MEHAIIKNQDILRIVSNAFEGIDTIRVQIGDGLRIFGLNKSSSIYYNLAIGGGLLDEEIRGVTVSGPAFSKMLDLSLASKRLEDFNELRIALKNNEMADLRITAKHTKIDETLAHVTSGIKQEPSYIRDIDFSRAAKCCLLSPSGYSLVHDHYVAIQGFVPNVEPLEMTVIEDGLVFKPYCQTDHVHLLGGLSSNTAKSLISLADIDMTSKVAGQLGIESLCVQVIEGGAMRFLYGLKAEDGGIQYDGFLEYIVSRSFEPGD
jgi:hypothetical protein